MKTQVIALTLFATVACFGMTVQECIAIAATDTSKIAEVMPVKPEDQAKFKFGLLEALSKMPASPVEKKNKIAKAKKTFVELEAKRQEKLIVFPVASPETFTGAMALDAASSQTNSVALTNTIWVLEEVDMGYGLDRKPRTMDKSKKYYPGWRRGEDIEPGGYPCQTIW